MKYSKEAPDFADPVMRCDRCRVLLLESKAVEDGRGCPKCGGRKLVELRAFNLREYLKMRFWWRVDPDFLDVFARGEDG